MIKDTLAITVISKNCSGVVTPKDLEHIHINKFNEDAAKEFYKIFRELLSNDSVSVIPIFIDSYGGNVHSLLVMLDLITNSHKPVATIAMGKAMSCGAILLAAGTKGYRFAAENTDIMLHEVASVELGKISEMDNGVKQTKKMNDNLFSFLASKSNKDKKFFLNKIKSTGNVDWFLTSKQFKSLGLIDHIGIPQLVQR
jgi:ATP-dependent Clp protease protease subunit